jgi:predicted dehydrogenase
MSGKRVRFAVIGAGMIGAVHAAALAELPETAELVAIVDSTAPRRSPWPSSMAPSTPTT